MDATENHVDAAVDVLFTAALLTTPSPGGWTRVVITVVIAAVVAFVASGAWYAAVGSRLTRWNAGYEAGSRPGAATVAVELVRNMVVAAAIWWLAARTGDTLAGALALALLLWLAFPVVLLAGSVFHERVPAPLAAVHAADWLLKLLLIGATVGFWRS